MLPIGRRAPWAKLPRPTPTAGSIALAMCLVLLAAGPASAADTRPPVMGAVALTVPGSGKVGPTAAPLRARWTAADSGSGVARYRVQERVDGGSWVTVRPARATSTAMRLSVWPGHDLQVRVRAIDAAGNRSGWRSSDPVRARLVPESASDVVRTGTWRSAASSRYLGGHALRSATAGSTLAFASTASSVAVIARRSPSGGSAAIYVDGSYRATVNLHASSVVDRRIVFAARWASPGEHEVTIRVKGTPGHPNVVIDGFVVGSPPPADPVLVGAGDIATCGQPGDNQTARLLDAIPGRVFAAGDTAYPRGSAAQFRDCYDPTWGRWRLRTSPAPGNHEYLTAGAKGYYSYFGNRAGAPGKGWYAYDLGTWRIYSLNANCDQVGCGDGSEQLAWLEADLAAHPRACVAAVWHQPLFSSGVHGNDPAVRPLWVALETAGADLVLNGHDHDYERFAPQTADGVASASGIREFVVGTGGAANREFASAQPNSEVRSTGTFGVLKLTLRPDSYDWMFVPVAGSTFSDSGSGTCR